MSRLPLELVAEICEFLRADCVWPSATAAPLLSQSMKALDTCSLVCWSWHAIAQQHLFHSITYSYQEKPAKPDEMAGHIDEYYGRWGVFERRGRRRMMPRKSFAMFVAFLDQHPHIRPYIHCLNLICYTKPLMYDDDWTFDTQTDASDDPVSFTDFTRLLRFLPRLEELELDDFTINHIVGEYQFGDRTKLHYLSSKWSPGLLTANTLAVILRCFSTIANIKIDDFKLAPASGSLIWPSFHARSSVEAQYLYVFDIDGDISRLSELVFTCKSLGCLDVSLAEGIAPLQMRPMLAHVGSTLQGLEIVFPCANQWGYQDDTFLDLSSCTHLRYLTLGIPLLGFFSPYTLDNDGGRYGHALSELERTLQSISGPLRTFSLNIGVFSERHLSKRFLRTFMPRTAALNISLRDLAHRHDLRRVNVEYFATVPLARRQSLRGLLGTALPSLARAGLLKLTLFERGEEMPELYEHWISADGTYEGGRWWD